MTAKALTIGNFDGVHLGHQKLIERVCWLAAKHGLSAAAVTFDPHPTKLLAPERAPKLLMSLEARIAQMRRYGLDEVICLPFDQAMANLSPEQFAARKPQVLYLIIGSTSRRRSRQPDADLAHL